ncbi:hypothetical protein [Enterobacter roggenkampii]|uniref:hypothetical protein n=1 Tax=Enterobacter roggenkampii TaxID=1812935 RepID=UPI000614A729|nr:hypothetical protein [Enterobacter roggenkampii]
MTKATFTGCQFINNGIGILASGDIQLEAHDTLFQGNGKAVLIDSGIPEELAPLFKEGVNINKVRQLIEETRRTPDPQPDSIAQSLWKSGLSSWLANGANAVTVATAIIEFVKFIGR